jgi:hypothetical protein
VLSDFEPHRDCDIGIQGEQRFVWNRLRKGVVSIEAVCPPADDDDLGKPRGEGLKQLGEAIEFRIVNFVAYGPLMIMRSFIA